MLMFWIWQKHHIIVHSDHLSVSFKLFDLLSPMIRKIFEARRYGQLCWSIVQKSTMLIHKISVTCNLPICHDYVNRLEVHNQADKLKRETPSNQLQNGIRLKLHKYISNALKVKKWVVFLHAAIDRLNGVVDLQKPRLTNFMLVEWFLAVVDCGPSLIVFFPFYPSTTLFLWKIKLPCLRAIFRLREKWREKFFYLEYPLSLIYQLEAWVSLELSWINLYI